MKRALFVLFFILVVVPSCEKDDQNELTSGEEAAQYLQQVLKEHGNPWIQTYYNNIPEEWTSGYHFKGEFLYTVDHYYNMNHLVYFEWTWEGDTQTMKIYFSN